MHDKHEEVQAALPQQQRQQLERLQRRMPNIGKHLTLDAHRSSSPAKSALQETDRPGTESLDLSATSGKLHRGQSRIVPD